MQSEINLADYAHPDIERGLLGAAMLTREDAEELIRRVNREDFYDPKHQTVYDGINAALKDSNDTKAIPEPAVVARALGDGIKAINGDGRPMSFLCGVQSDPCFVGSFDFYAKTVSEDARTRRYLLETRRMASEAKYLTPDEIQARMDRAMERADRGLPLVGFKELTAEVDDELKAKADGRVVESGAPVLWPSLRNYLGRARSGELVLVGARPGVGKTTFATTWAAHIFNQSIPVLFCSMEMTGTELTKRILSAETGIEFNRIRNGLLSVEDRRRINETRTHLDACPFTVLDKADLRVIDIRAAAKSVLPSGDGIVFVDYLQLLKPAKRETNREREVAAMSRDLKVLARELKVPVVAMCQLKRRQTDRQSPRPKLDDLRESGGLEADADVVLLLHRPDGDKAVSGSTANLDVIIAKQRNGPTGHVHLTFDLARQRITDMEGT